MSTPHLTHNLDTPEKKDRFLVRLAQVVLEVEAAWPLVGTADHSSGTAPSPAREARPQAPETLVPPPPPVPE